MPANAFEELQWRGMVFDYVEGVQSLLATQKVTVYNGFDVTADSLHIGHMVPLLALARLQRYGHHPIAVAGGGTSMIGDPSGKSAERQLLTRDQVEHNTQAIKAQLARFLDFESRSNPARLVNNADWLMPLNLIDFLRDIGKYFTVNYMIAKDSVRSRIDREEGISFTEFSYMLLQSYDFLHLHRAFGCQLQTGGSDQWGNITAGVELVRRAAGSAVYGMVYPLITKADGTKFGKTESGAVWLDAKRTSPYRFYQFWLNTDDRDVIHYLKVFTFLSQDEMAALEDALRARPEQREAQRTLARTMTAMLHGESALARAEQAAQALFGGAVEGLSAAEIEDIFADVPSAVLGSHALGGGGMNIVDLLADCGMMKSRGEARRAISEGGVYLNNHRVAESERVVTLADLLEGGFLILRRGKKTYFLVKVAQG
ncbi:MAG: tyrosine--tRNA ligase [Chloroflexota bacterium]